MATRPHTPEWKALSTQGIHTGFDTSVFPL